MTKASLKDTLRAMVLEYGFEQVDASLQDIGFSGRPKQKAGVSNGSAVTRVATRRKPKPTAPQYVAKMELPLEIEPTVVELAERFQSKSFLPTFGDIVNFCSLHGIHEPASKSRTNAIPRVFKLIASMEANEVQRILDEGMFSGPSRLGPIADAIRHNGRARAAVTSSNSPGIDSR